MSDLTTNFSFKEFFVSAEHPEIAAELYESTIIAPKADMIMMKAFYLARMFLQPARDMYQESIQILSGVRSKRLNTLIGGAETSDHLYLNECAAVDITCRSIDSLANMLANSKLPYGQMIWYPEQRFVHISLPSRRHFRDTLKKIDGKFSPFFSQK